MKIYKNILNLIRKILQTQQERDLIQLQFTIRMMKRNFKWSNKILWKYAKDNFDYKDYKDMVSDSKYKQWQRINKKLETQYINLGEEKEELLYKLNLK